MRRKTASSCFISTESIALLLFISFFVLVPTASASDMIPSSPAGEWIWKDIHLAGVPDASEETPAEPTPKEGPCLPLHTIEGNSGHFSVMSAYLANPAPEGEIFGMPSVGFINVDLNHGKTLRAFTLTETLFDRVEIGYAYDNLDVGDFYEDVGNVLGVRPAGHQVRLHNFNLRYQIFHENSGGRTWVPALAYLPTTSLSVAAGYGHFGHLANHTANRGFGVAIKYEF